MCAAPIGPNQMIQFGSAEEIINSLQNHQYLQEGAQLHPHVAEMVIFVPKLANSKLEKDLATIASKVSHAVMSHYLPELQRFQIEPETYKTFLRDKNFQEWIPFVDLIVAHSNLWAKVIFESFP